IAGIGTATAGLTVARAGFPVAGQSSTPVIDDMGTPAASPVASPVATPLPDPVPPTALEVIREQRPEPAGTPQQARELRLYVRSADLHDFSPTAQKQDYQIPLSYMDPLVWLDEVTMEPEPWL